MSGSSVSNMISVILRLFLVLVFEWCVDSPRGSPPEASFGEENSFLRMRVQKLSQDCHRERELRLQLEADLEDASDAMERLQLENQQLRARISEVWLSLLLSFSLFPSLIFGLLSFSFILSVYLHSSNHSLLLPFLCVFNLLGVIVGSGC